ncbi:hypothetical protein CT113_00920 [Levilactobacillus brevis]|uniref:hypothetical protein n=1 Tax=Levilactobacillus brevis TaxID=1580 RepID=UPI00040B0747|nr:hypothetical protein [Levilactobacillus brevis]ATU68967.1 hypothetical protein CT113_00920 [Levilactobacillus brevis]
MITTKVVLCGSLEDVEKRMMLDYDILSKDYPQVSIVKAKHTIQIVNYRINKYISVRQLDKIDSYHPRYMEADVSAFWVAKPSQMKSAVEKYRKHLGD